MFNEPARPYFLTWLTTIALLMGFSGLGAEENNTALLAISLHEGHVTAGMMCNGTEFGDVDHPGNPPPPMSRKLAPNGAMCLRSSASILNPDVLAFDVTLWPRQAIADLASRLQLMDDPLNYDFSKVSLAGRKVRRIEETQAEGDLDPVFEFSFGCYLLMKAAEPGSAPGS